VSLEAVRDDAGAAAAAREDAAVAAERLHLHLKGAARRVRELQREREGWRDRDRGRVREIEGGRGAAVERRGAVEAGDPAHRRRRVGGEDAAGALPAPAAQREHERSYGDDGFHGKGLADPKVVEGNPLDEVPRPTPRPTPSPTATAPPTAVHSHHFL